MQPLIVWFTAGPTTYDFEIHVASPVFKSVEAEPTTSTPSDDEVGEATVGRVSLTPDQKLLIVALCEPFLRRREAGTSQIPSSAAAAERLGWTLTRFNRKLDNVCQKLADAGTRGLHGGVGSSPRIARPGSSSTRSRPSSSPRTTSPCAASAPPRTRGRHVPHRDAPRRGRLPRGRGRTGESMSTAATKRRIGVISTVVVALVASLLVWIATRSEGEVVRKADLNDGGIWVTNAEQSRYGRINKAAAQLDAGILSDESSNGSGLDVLPGRRGRRRPVQGRQPDHADQPGRGHARRRAGRRAAQGEHRHRQPRLHRTESSTCAAAPSR